MSEAVDRGALYAAWRAHDDAREARQSSGVLGTPGKAVGGVPDGIGNVVAQDGEASPRASNEVLGPMGCSCNTQEFPDGLFTSVRTGRDYLPKVTPGGMSFGFEARTKFVHITAAGHTVERGTGGRLNVGKFVDELAAKLKGRAEAVALIKGHLRKPEHHEAVDEWLQRSFRYPACRKVKLKQLSALLDTMGLKALDRQQSCSVLNKLSFRRTWDD